MLLLELAIQGVRGLPAVHLKLHPLSNVFVGQRDQLATLQRAVRALMVGPTEAHPVAVAENAPLAQAAATFALPGGVVLRLGRDLGSGRARLSRRDESKNAFVPITEDAVEAAQYLCSSAGFCDADTFDRCFVFAPPQLPTHDTGAHAPLAGATPVSLGSHDDLAAAKAQLREIEQQLLAGQRTEAIEFELDGLQKRRFALEDELRSLADPDAAVTAAQAQLARFARLPADLFAQYAAYQQAVKHRNDDLQRLEEEQAKLVAHQPQAPTTLLIRNRWLWGSMAIGAVGVAVALIFGGSLRYAALLDIPGFGVAAALLWRRLSLRDRVARYVRRLSLFAGRADKIKARDADLITGTEKMLAALGLASAAEVEAALSAQRRAEAAIQAAVLARSASDTDHRRSALQGERGQLDAKISALDDELLRANAGMDFATLRSAAQKLRLRLMGGEGAAVAEVLPSIPESPGPLDGLLQSACDLWLMPRPVAIERLAGVASALIESLTAGRLTGIELSGTSLVLRASDGRALSWHELEASLFEPVYLALRFALVEGCDERATMPVCVLGDGLCATAQRLLGSSRQLLLHSEHELSGTESVTVRLPA